mmetsp:Transcript_4524/g.9378  ORF Transcript_4524/g.9378 Transcript_4524/m.9378 type:complete len:866 (+) Transcript_4524:66-2663(+)
MKSYRCGVLPSTTDYHHQRLRRKPSLAISVLIFACMLSSSIVLFFCKSTTSNHPNANQNDILVVLEKAAAGNHHRRVSGGSTSKVVVAQSAVHFNTLNDDNHRNMQTSSPQRCINISIFLDEYPADTSWIIIDDSTTGGNAVATSPDYDATMALTQQVETICLAAPGTYSFVISDDYEDGICCVWGEGNYTVTTSSTVIAGDGGDDDDVQVLAEGGAWKGPNETTTFELLAAPAPPTNVPTLQPNMMYIEPASEERINVTTQVNIYLTGVPSNQNMTTTEQEVFESLFYTVLQSRLETVDVGILEVVVDAQINDPQFDADSPFDSSQSDSNGGGDTKLLSSVLQLVTNVTLTYSDPPPEGWRDWSIYLTSWIESFGPTMVDIFTDPKHNLYPNQEFFNTISDVSGTNVVPPNTDPTMSPTLAPTYLGAPEYKKPLVTGLAVAGVVVVVLFFGGAVWWKWRRVGLARTHNIGNGNDQEEDEEEREKKEEEEEEELGSIDEDNSLPQDVVVASLPSSTVPKSNSNDDVHDDDDDDDEEGEDVINDDESDEGDDDDESESVENIVTSLPMIIEETAPPTPPRQESPTLAPPLPNELQDDDVVQYNEIVAAVMANDPNLTQVVLDNKHQIGNNDGGEALWEALTTNNHVQLLSLRNSNITDDQMAALALALNENTSISRLSLQSNMFTSEGVEYLIVCLVCNSTIDVVDLEGNSPIDPRILDELCGILQSRGVPNHSNKLELLLERIRGNDPNLTQLDLRGMGIGQEDNDAIMDALAGNAYLRKVDLSDNMIDDDGVSALSLALADNTSITHMCLAENRITSIGAEYLLCALDTNDTIVDVDLAGNSIDAGVMDELNHALKQRRTVDGY